ncbi:FimV/HubP family polar landmark protein [Pseudoxanthomonas spadix]|uniref:FimV/HubP family polar landmark protein n=1 Tax=Pseudoxanthomonas spadix TaxID=415229 RepID=UPI003CCD39D1
MSLRLAGCKPVVRGVLGLVLLAASGMAMALGLGEMRVKSRSGQPLVAEIPVISGAPGELEQLRARLASPEIFERVGLQRPTGLVGQLDFAVALSDAGEPVIRVTSQDPVDTASVNFLIEVDWGQGRLVREYSALVGAPGALAAADAPQLQAPAPAPSNRIDRPAVAAAAAPLPGQPEESVASEGAASVASAPRADNSAPVAPTGVLETVRVQQGQSLSQIARSLQQGGTLDQTMIALLQANPQAFIDNNINRLRSGALLRVPPVSEMTALAAAEAAAMVRQQVSDWRQARQTVPQPADASGATPIPLANAAPAVAGARLEIAPPAADAAQRAGTTSGTQAGGEGDMLANEQLRQTREDLAARNAEVQELRTQVAELEKLRAQQAQLIAMKDSDLAAAQQRLGQAQGGAGVPAWLWIGALLVIVGLLAWALLRRHRGLRPTPVYQGALAVPPAAGPAESVPVATPPVEAAVPGSVPETARYTPVYVSAEPAPDTPASAPARVATPAWMQTATAKPTWHTVDGPQPAATRILSGISPAAAAPAPAADPVPAIAPSAGSRERLELAIAYLDLGDTEAARSLLAQVAAGDDHQARAEADKLLRELG